MNRLLLLLTGVVLTASLASGGVITPVPHLPASALQPRPQADEPAAEPEDPSTIADRIAENTKKAGDQLAAADAGEQTRKTQDQILRDIDKLLNQPPMSDGDSQAPMNPSQSSPPGQGGGMNRSGSGGPRSPGGSPSSNRQSRQQRREQAKQQAQAESAPGRDQPAAKKDGPPRPTGGTEPKPGSQGGTDPVRPGGSTAGLGGKGAPALPLDDAITKQVWGHLPERLRQHMSQYYQEQFMPKYGDLLQQYYSALAEREKGRK